MEKILVEKEAFDRMLVRLAHEIIEQNADISKIVLVGIVRRGFTLANVISRRIYEITGTEVKVGALDITLYRDDLTEIASMPSLKKTDLDFDVTGKIVIIVDDVIFTGRTVRCAIDALFDLGRPSKIQLLELVDRGHRELPIKPDYVGKNIPTSLNEVVMVKVMQYDGEQCIAIKKIDA